MLFLCVPATIREGGSGGPRALPCGVKGFDWLRGGAGEEGSLGDLCSRAVELCHWVTPAWSRARSDEARRLTPRGMSPVSGGASPST